MLPQDSCHHVFVEKKDPTDIIPPPDSSPDAATQYEIHAICQRCRYHLDLRIDYRGSFRNRADSGASISGSTFQPCPNSGYPLHHFQYIIEEAVPRHTGVGNDAVGIEDGRDRTFLFKCSANLCLAKLYISLRKPRFPEQYVHLLSDRAILESRLQAAKESDPERSDFKVARPTDAFDALSTYLRDSMDTSREKRQIPLKNRRFMVAFGADCAKLLQYLGFEVEDEDGNDDGYCRLPNPANQPDSEAFIAFLADVRDELLLLLQAQPEEDKRTLKNPSLTRRPLLKDIQCCLGYADYDKIPSSRRYQDLTGNEDSIYASLGALPDFSDRLIVFAFERQEVCDPDNLPHYYECLRQIFNARPNSDEIQMKVALLSSMGKKSRSEVADAYRYFGWDSTQEFAIDDAHIAGVYSSRLESVPMSQHPECRQMLEIIANSRDSRNLKDLASDVIETFDQALIFLGASVDMTDEFIQTMYVTKIADDPSNKDKARKALDIIANERNSLYLRSVLDSEDSTQPTMDVGEACSTLQIDDRTQLSLDMLPILLEARVQEAPNREDEFNRAAAVLTAHYEAFGDQANAPKSQLSTRRAEEWPVGIENLGATCYLNSLLQFYFTVKPLRNMLLSFDDYKIDITQQSIHSRKVGGRRVPAREVQRATDCKSLSIRTFEHR